MLSILLLPAVAAVRAILQTEPAVELAARVVI
jgi:hypothetical protein